MEGEVRGVWEFIGQELPEGSHVFRFDPVFCAYEYTSDRQSEIAWQKGWNQAAHVSLWRMSNRAETVWRIICMGETIARVQKVEKILVKHGGKFWTPEIAMIQALAMRRYKTALAEVQKQSRPGEEIQIVNRWKQQGGMILEADGTMKPFRPEQ